MVVVEGGGNRRSVLIGRNSNRSIYQLEKQRKKWKMKMYVY